MEYMTPNFTKDMVKTHKILIPNMAVTQFRLMQAALASEGYQTEVLGNCGSEVAQLGLKYVHNDTCYPALLVIGQFLDALNSGKYDLDHTALLITQTGGGCRASNYIKLLRKALVKAGYGNIPVASLNFSGLEKGSGLPLTVPLLRKVIASIFYGDMLVALRSQTHAYENHRGDADAMTEKWISTIQGWIRDDKNYSAHDMKRRFYDIAADYATIPITRVLDGGQPVRDDQHRADGTHLFQRILNQKLGLGVNIRRGFVQNHNAWLVDDRPRKAQQLALPGGEVVPALADLLVQTVVQLVNELVGVDIAADL